MYLSFWEYKTWLTAIDFTVIGSGIVGLSTALELRKRFPKAKILIMEKGVLPQGASTKNAGFACFGSISEILSDLEKHSEEEVKHLVAMRLKGIQLLRKNLGDNAIGYEQHGGHEIFLDTQTDLFEKCLGKLPSINQLLCPVFKEDPFVLTENRFGFRGIKERYITQKVEGQIDTGKMMQSLLRRVHQENILLLNGVALTSFSEKQDSVHLLTDRFECKTNKLLITTNGFARKFIKADIQPARAQVLVTQPIDHLNIQGTFHFDEGYYYFRNIDNRVLFGGGRNLDFKTEATTTFGQTELVQSQLEQLLREVILPETDFEVEQRWSGIMGIGAQKKPIVKQLSNNVFCGVRLGGMGVAIGSSVGQELAAMLY
ncbi:MAG: FAD-dependent oxidoreductase [Bacteroidota bacterium]